MAIFNSYVKLPEGMLFLFLFLGVLKQIQDYWDSGMY